MKIKHVHVIPLLLDLDNFRQALLLSINTYSHVAGHLLNNSGNWIVNTYHPPNID
jgi:hypothetical protein